MSISPGNPQCVAKSSSGIFEQGLPILVYLFDAAVIHRPNPFFVLPEGSGKRRVSHQAPSRLAASAGRGHIVISVTLASDNRHISRKPTFATLAS